MYPLVVIVGPTAAGKSTLGIKLAQAMSGEIISGDSVQVYRKLNIGSAKPSLEEQENIPHHLLDVFDPAEPFTVAQFQSLALQLIKQIRERGHIPILVGGTGLYIRSLLDPFEFPESGSDEVKQKWQDFLHKHGKAALYQALKERDPQTAERLHPNDVFRIIRALEVYELSGQPLSKQRQALDKEYFPLDRSIIYVGLTAPREILYQRINERCEIMIKEGLVEETLQIINDGYSTKLKPLQSIGYRHAIWYLHGVVTLHEMVRLLQRDTRHFAKRQLTWFRRDPRISWYDISEINMDQIVRNILATCRARQTRVE